MTAHPTADALGLQPDPYATLMKLLRDLMTPQEQRDFDAFVESMDAEPTGAARRAE